MVGQWIETLVLIGCIWVMSAVQQLDNPFDFYSQVGEDIAEALANGGENMSDDSSTPSGTATQEAADTQTEIEETEAQTGKPSEWDIWRQKAENQGQEI